MTPQDAQIQQLRTRAELAEEENEILRARLQQISVLSRTALIPLEWGLTGKEAEIVGVLLKRQIASREQLMVSLYSDRIYPPDIKILDIFICKIRKKLKLHGVRIYTAHGQGWYLDAELRRTLNEKLGEAA